MTRRYLLTLLLLGTLRAALMTTSAQTFFNLTADEVRIDSTLPRFTHSCELGADYADSTYRVTIDYPEFIDMTKADVARYLRIRRDTVSAMPAIEQYVGVSRKQGTLYVAFSPIVFREGRFQKLVSFSLGIHAEPKAATRHLAPRKAQADSGRYANHSLLASGRWAKIRVAQTGIHQLTESVIRQAGFSSLQRVKIYGYGGNLQPEKLTSEYLAQTDDLQEVPTCTVNGRRLFWGKGPVSWSTNTTLTRTRNPYSDYGYYFITETDDEPLSVDTVAFAQLGYPATDDYHSLYEVDNYAWMHSGRNLFEANALVTGTPSTYTLQAYSEEARLSVVMTYDGPFQAKVLVNGKEVGELTASDERADYVRAMTTTKVYDLTGLQASNEVSILQTSGATMRLDYITLCSTKPAPMPSLESATLPTAEYYCNITNQDHHADPAADMVIIIPTTQKLLAQAQRLKQLHEEKDSMRINIVPADELFNEFSSGTPDANAYRRYLKMLYDRAQTSDDMPSHLLLFGDAAWDNRMNSSDWRKYSPDDFLLCYESENSMSDTHSYVAEEYFCMLDDDEGGNLLSADKADVAVGRLPARTPEEARILVDKIYSYRNNEQAGAWQNTICFMADDGNGNDQNEHMSDAEALADIVEKNQPGFMIKKVYWDAYTRQTTATGNRYPDATKLIKQQMQAGALLMNYCGHGAAYQLSHEQVLLRSDFAESTSLRLPMWFTASCDIMPFDSQTENIGETAMFNENGGAIAFLGTTRTVYQNFNRRINQAYLSYLFDYTNGKPNSIGEALRLAKNKLIATKNSGEQDLTDNKLHYVLLGDPALVLATPRMNIVIDSIDGKPVSQGTVTVKAGSHATVSGHIEGKTSFDGTVTITVRDVEQTIVCKKNYNAQSGDPFVFNDRLNTFYQGSDYVTNGRFCCSFALPKDVTFSEQTGQVLAFAIDNEKTAAAHGKTDNIKMAGQDDDDNDGIGPSIYCYLNSEAFSNGGTVNATPFFYAQLTDKDGINAAGSGIGHDLELVIDGDVEQTYHLNDYFQYEFGDYRSGSVGYSLPELSAGSHQLLFRAWDVLNNSSVARLDFVVEPQQKPSIANVVCTKNPATTHTSFIISHDRAGSHIDVTLEVFDTSGRKLWEKSESGVSANQAFTMDWDLTTGSGNRLHTGVYLYRVLVSSNGSKQASAAQKLIILYN